MTAPAFVLLGDASEESRLLVDRGASPFAMWIPGHPRVTPDAAFDACLTLADVPVEIGLRLEPIATPVDAVVAVAALARTYAADRTEGPPDLEPLARPPEALAALTATYDLRGEAGVREWLAVEVGPGVTTTCCLYLTVRHRAGALSPIEWVNLRTGIAVHQSWDASARQPPIWPRSELALPSARLRLTPGAQRDAEIKAADLGPLDDAEARLLVDTLLAVATSDASPCEPVTPDEVDKLAFQLARSVPPRPARVLQRDLDRVRTVHDARAWCVQNLWAIEHRLGV